MRPKLSMTRPTAAFSLFAALLLGCGGNELVGPGQLSISVLSGNGQSGFPLQPLSTPITVLVTDASGAGVTRAIVRFTVTAGGGTVSPVSVGTDEHGQASTTWTLGSVGEAQSVSATVYNSPEAHADFSASATREIISIISGNNQEGTGGLTLSAPLVVKATTVDGAPVPGATINWMRGGVLVQNSTTDAQGLTSIRWALEPSVGTQTIDARAKDFVPPSNVLTFSATAGLPAIVLGYDGTAWRTVLADTSFKGLSFNAIWGASASNIYAVGRCVSTSPGVQYDGAVWKPLPAGICTTYPGPPPSGPAVFVSIWGSSAS